MGRRPLLRRRWRGERRTRAADYEHEPVGTYTGEPVWPAELIGERDIRHATAGGMVDVLASHDMPYGTQPRGFDLWDDPSATANRVQLRRIVEKTKPLLVLHGHYHRRHQSELTLRDGHELVVVGLPDAANPPVDTLVLRISQLAALARDRGRTT